MVLKLFNTIIFLCVSFFLFINSELDCRIVGSNTAVSRQLAAFFPAADTDNQMLGFALFEKGIRLEDNITTCSFNDVFPLSGSAVLNGGTLYLLRDLELDCPFALGPGTIDGKTYAAVDFPEHIAGIEVPSANHTKLLDLVYSSDFGSQVYSIDWSYDDKYLAIGIESGTPHYEVEIYYVEDNTLTLTAYVNLPSDALSVRWHPSSYYLAVGGTWGGELGIYYLNTASGTFNKTSSVALPAVSAVAWSPNGNYLAEGQLSSNQVRIYAISGGVLGTYYAGTYPRFKAVQRNALDWDSTGNYIAIGVASGHSNPELMVYYFNGSTVVSNSSLTFGSTVYALGWHPTLPLLAVGKSIDTQRLVLYEHNGGAGTLTYLSECRQADVSRTVYGLGWSDDGIFLAAGMEASTLSLDAILFVFDEATYGLDATAGDRFGSNVNAVGLSHNATYLAVGYNNDYFQLFGLISAPFTFRDVNLFFKSDVMIEGPIIIQGNCYINAGGNVIKFDETYGSIIVDSGAQLLIEDAQLQGIGADDVACRGNSSVLTLRDVQWHQDSLYTFSIGSIRFENNVLMHGDTTFVYSSAQTSTILSESTLTIENGFTFSYAPPIASKDLLVLEDDSSSIFLNGGALYSTSTGLRLSTGHLLIDRLSTLSNDGLVEAEGMILDSDLSIQCCPAAVLNLSGSIII